MEDGFTHLLHFVSAIVALAGLAITKEIYEEHDLYYVLVVIALTVIVVGVIQMYNEIRCIKLQMLETQKALLYMQQCVYDIATKKAAGYPTTMPMYNNVRPQNMPIMPNQPNQNNMPRR